MLRKLKWKLRNRKPATIAHGFKQIKEFIWVQEGTTGITKQDWHLLKWAAHLGRWRRKCSYRLRVTTLGICLWTPENKDSGTQRSSIAEALLLDTAQEEAETDKQAETSDQRTLSNEGTNSKLVGKVAATWWFFLRDRPRKALEEWGYSSPCIARALPREFHENQLLVIRAWEATEYLQNAQRTVEYTYWTKKVLWPSNLQEGRANRLEIRTSKVAPCETDSIRCSTNAPWNI